MAIELVKHPEHSCCKCIKHSCVGCCMIDSWLDSITDRIVEPAPVFTTDSVKEHTDDAESIADSLYDGVTH